MGWFLILAPLLLVAGAVSLVLADMRRRRTRGAWRVISHPVTIWTTLLAGVLGALLWWLSVRKINERCTSDGLCGIAMAPLGQWSASGPFRALAERDADCRAAVWCSAISTPTAKDPYRPAFGVRNPPVGKQPEGCRANCSISGRCSAFDGVCQAKTNADCAVTEACVLWGECTASDGSCFAARDEDCAGSRACRVLGRCSAIGGACRVADHVELPLEDHPNIGPLDDHPLVITGRALRDEIHRCRSLPACRDEGRCDLDASGHCVVGTDEDCSASAACPARGACQRWSDNEQAECAASCIESDLCKKHGRCVRMANGLCGTGEARDCEESEACRLEGRCALIDGTCQATAEICSRWDGCAFDGRCGVTAGECRLTEDGCSHSIPCAKLGACSASAYFEGCGVGGHADCEHSEVCEKYGWCRALGVGYWPMTTSRWFCFSEPKR